MKKMSVAEEVHQWIAERMNVGQLVCSRTLHEKMPYHRLNVISGALYVFERQGIVSRAGKHSYDDGRWCRNFRILDGFHAKRHTKSSPSHPVVRRRGHSVKVREPQVTPAVPTEPVLSDELAKIKEELLALAERIEELEQHA